MSSWTDGNGTRIASNPLAEEAAAQPGSAVTLDSTSPIEIVDATTVAQEDVEVDEEAETLAGGGGKGPGGGQVASASGSGSGNPGNPGGGEVIPGAVPESFSGEHGRGQGGATLQAPPPLPLPPGAARARVRARSGGERVPGPVATTQAPLSREQVLERLRRGESLRGASLRGADLSGARLGPADLARADLERADLRGATLEKANLRGASLRGARLSDADLRGSTLESADLTEADLRQAVLIQANLSLARLEDADLAGANLAGADLSLAQLRATRLPGANLKDAVFTHAHLVRANLSGCKALGADFVDADLRGAVLAEGDFTGAAFTEARLSGVDARKARLGGVSLVDADLRRADLGRADLSHADLRRANLAQAILGGASFTGAKVEGLVPAGAEAEGLVAAWVDGGAGGDAGARLEGAAALAAISGTAVRADTQDRRYFGRGDVVRNATFDFGDRARVEIDSRLEDCVLVLGEGAELVVGRAGALLDSQVRGGARIVIHGRVFEREAPAIAGARSLVVGASGRVQATVAQAEGGTRFAFERGCRLRLAIGSVPDPAATEKEREKGAPSAEERAGAAAEGHGDSDGEGRDDVQLGAEPPTAPGLGAESDDEPITLPSKARTEATAAAAGVVSEVVAHQPSTGLATSSDATVVGPAAHFEGKLRTEGDVVVRGRLTGELEARRIEVAARAVVNGRLSAPELRAWGTTTGDLEGETIELGGRLGDGSTVRATTLVVRPDDGTPLRLGTVTLEVGPAPDRDEENAEPAPGATPDSPGEA